MKIFVDTANLQEIEEALKRGFIDGVTTNPSLLAKEPKANFESHISKIVELITKYKRKRHLSVEVFTRDPAEILEQAKRFNKEFKNKFVDLSVKVQVGWDELAIIHKLAEKKISVNCTVCMDIAQGVMAACAGARYISFFWGRIRDGGSDEKFKDKREQALKNRVLDIDDFDPAIVVKRAREIFDRDRLKTEIIAGSMRNVLDIRDAGLAGAHIVTIPPKFFKDMISHFKTDEVVEQFLSDFNDWLR